jgi:hypothetical protein
MSITSSKMKFFELFQNKNLSSNICPQTGFSQFSSLAFKHCVDSIEKCNFFLKKVKKSKIPSRSKKKMISEKKFFHEVLISIRRINVQKIFQIGDGHWSLGRFLQKTAL